MIWSRETGAVELTGADMRMLADEPDNAAIFARLLRSDYPRSPAVPPLLCQRMMPLLMKRHSTYLSYLLDYVQLMKLSNDPSKCYHKFTVPKKDGIGKRTIFVVAHRLKNVQQWILREVLDHLPVSDHARAYRRGVTLLDNAAPHVGHKVLVKLDIRDFFGSTRYPAVYDVFRSAGYGVPVCTLLANLCCLNGVLPQGSAASPALSNLCFRRCDEGIAEYCDKRGITYTRYSDDMSFSGDFDPYALIAFMRKLLAAFGYIMNEGKTRIFKQGQRQSVTGIVINDRPQTTKEYRKSLRQAFYYIEKHGLIGHYIHLTENGAARSSGGFRSYTAQLGGRLGFALSVNPEDTELMKYDALFIKQRSSAFAMLDAEKWLCPITGGGVVLPQALRLDFAENTFAWRYCVSNRELCLELRPPLFETLEKREQISGMIYIGKDGRLELPDDFLSTSTDNEVIIKTAPQYGFDGFYISFAKRARGQTATAEQDDGLDF